MTPLHKSGSKDDLRNYPTISVLPVVSKVLERLIHKQLASFFDDYNLLCKLQSDFRRMHSTETAVTYFADEIFMSMDKGLVTGSVFIDLAKAFDTVDRDILLRKLEYYGICDESLPWFKNYFKGRKQFVHIDSQSSEELAITSGVPQGSILGPLLFIVYINDLPRCVKHFSVNMYGDDTVLYLAGPTVDNLTFYINQDLQCLSEWLEDNNLVLNVSKTKCVLFTSRRHKERDCILNLNLLGKSISCETTFKYLDVVFDNFMTWKAHADYVCKKVASRVSILGRIRSFVTKEAATLVHNALILPLFDYCDIAWSNLLQQDIDRLQRLQNRSARIITRCSRSSEAIEQLQWPTLSSRRYYHKAKLVFLCLHSLVPSYFSSYFTRLSNVHNYSTRQSMRLSQNFGKRTFLFTGAETFNNLPLNIVKSEKIQTFCRQARHFFLS